LDPLKPTNESLHDIVFRDRNRDYGAYQFRKKYGRTLLWSVIFGVIVYLTGIFIPFALYFLNESGKLEDNDFVYEVEYMPINPPESNDLDELARALAKPPDEVQQAPVVTDTVIPEKEVKPPVEPPEKKEDSSDADSAGASGGIKGGTGAGDASGIATVIDVYPRFPGGDESRLAFLKRNVKYPLAAMQSGVQGVVVVVFIIERDGTLSNIQIERGIGGGCDEESVRVVKMMPLWEPGKRQGKAVRVMVRMPVVFRIPGKKT
jgi:periplasmic protein TonB